MPSQDLGEIAVHVGLVLRCLEACYNKNLVKGCYYKVLQLEPLTLEEQLDRYGESARRRVQPALESLGKKLTRTEAVTAASVQGGHRRRGIPRMPFIRPPQTQPRASSRINTTATGRNVHTPWRWTGGGRRRRRQHSRTRQSRRR